MTARPADLAPLAASVGKACETIDALRKENARLSEVVLLALTCARGCGCECHVCSMLGRVAREVGL